MLASAIRKKKRLKLNFLVHRLFCKVIVKAALNMHSNYALHRIKFQTFIFQLKILIQVHTKDKTDT